MNVELFGYENSMRCHQFGTNLRKNLYYKFIIHKAKNLLLSPFKYYDSQRCHLQFRLCSPFYR
jgi:hypothetical protein